MDQIFFVEYMEPEKDYQGTILKLKEKYLNKRLSFVTPRFYCFSRILWLEVCKTNNNPASYYAHRYRKSRADQRIEQLVSEFTLIPRNLLDLEFSSMRCLVCALWFITE